MGEKIKDIGKVTLGQSTFTVELNEPLFSKGDKQIHFQSDKGRMEMNLKEFVKLATAVYISSERLQKMKGVK